jgi:tetratricopeptide (TPR) repeat protein
MPRRVAPVLVIAALTVASYAAGLPNALIYDDHEVIVAQPAPRTWSDVARLWTEPHFRGLPYYRPVVRTTLLVAVNLALAAAAGLVAYALLRRPAFAVRPFPALLAAGLFAVHPIASSCVYPAASGRETLLPTLLGLCALAAHLRSGAAWRALSWLALAAALFGKEASVVLVPLFVIADALRLSEDPPGRSPRRWLARYVPLVVLLALYFAVRRALFAGGEWRFALQDDPAGPLLAILYGVQTVFAPSFALAYEPETGVWWSGPRLAVALAAAAVVAAGVWRAGAQARRAGLFWAAWFVLAQLPTAHVLEQEAPFDERYVFLASLAPFAAGAAALSAPLRSRRARAWLLRAVVALLALASFTSLHRSHYFRDDVTFASQWLRTNPGSPEALLTLGLARSWSGDLPGAIALYEQAIAEHPGFANAYVNLGTALVAQGRHGEARTRFERALALSPDLPEALNGLGLVFAAAGRYEDAVRQYDAAVRQDPRFVAAWNNRGTALARAGDRGGAEASLREALRIAPGYEDARRNLALLEAQKRADGPPSAR